MFYHIMFQIRKTFRTLSEAEQQQYGLMVNMLAFNWRPVASRCNCTAALII